MSQQVLHAGTCLRTIRGFPHDEADCTCREGKLKLFGEVVKSTGDYRYPGIVVSIFRTMAHGNIRYVVESTSPDTTGMLHIFSANQLEPR